LILLALEMSIMVSVNSAQASGDSWVQKAPMNVARGGLGVAVVNGKIYAIGGSNQTIYNEAIVRSGIRGEPVGTNEEYDPATNMWAFKSSMPTPRDDFAIAVFQGKIYCIGGFLSAGVSSANEVYDPATDTWDNKTSGISGGPIQANVVNGKIYLIKENVEGKGINMVYDPASDNWTVKTPNDSSTFGSTSVSFDDKIYVLGGGDLLAGAVSSNQIYDVNKDTWSTRSGAYPPMTVYSAAAAATTGVCAPRRIYLMGRGVSYYATDPRFPNLVYDPAQNNWIFGASVPTGRVEFGIAVVDDLLFVIGGHIEANWSTIADPAWIPSSVNERYTPTGYVAPNPTASPTTSPTTSTTPSVSPSPSLTPSPSIPEFPSWIILPAFLIIATLAVVSIKKKK
jgi:hypothetical protein